MAFDLEPTPGLFQPASSRRRLLKLGFLAAASCLAPTLTQAAPQSATERMLAFHHLHTGERLQTVYWQHGAYIKTALADINFILRDHHTNDMIAIDTGLLDLLHALQQKLNTEQPFHIISGYRSPKTNAMLRRQGRGVAKKSMHMKGQAAWTFGSPNAAPRPCGVRRWRYVWVALDTIRVRVLCTWIQAACASGKESKLNEISRWVQQPSEFAGTRLCPTH